MEKIWLSCYPEGVPAEINPDRYKTLVDLFEQATVRFANSPAFINQGRIMTFTELEERSKAFAAYLQSLGLKKDDRIALMMPNLMQYPIAFFGALRAGLIVVNVNPLYTPRELKHQLNDCSAKAIVIVSNFAHALEKIIAKTELESVILTHIGDQLTLPKRSIVNFAVKYVKKLVPKYNLPGAISFRAALRKGRSLAYVKPNIANGDIALLQYTGGTTGVAKGAMLTHRNILANVEQAKASYLPLLQVGHELVVTALPLYHIFALTVNLMLFIELGGRNLLITNPRDIKGLVKELSRYPFTAMTGVNTLFNALINNDAFKKLDFSHYHLTVGGGMAVQKSIAERWQKITGTFLLEGYGLTECAPLVAGNPYDLKEYSGSIGIPVPSTEIRVVDDSGRDVEQGQPGELLVRGPQVMLGYWQRPKATEEIIQNDWLSTGDIVEADNQGFLRIVDRKKDMILVSGFNVYPNEIEGVMMHHHKVLEVAVIGLPSQETGEFVKAFVVRKDPTLTKDELIKHCRESLTGYKIPRVIEFCEVLPKSNVGKILRRELKERALTAQLTHTGSAANSAS